MTNTMIQRPNVAEYVRSLTDEEKDIALIELMDEAIRLNGGRCLIPLRRENGDSMGYFVPPAIAQAQLKAILPTLTPEQQEITRAALAEPWRTFDVDEFLDELSRKGQD